jgi:hypothetical protein
MRKTTRKARKTRPLDSGYPTGYNAGIMPKTFAILFSLQNAKSTVHSHDCRCVKQATARRHPVIRIVAESAVDAATQYDEGIAEQEQVLPRATICKCAK